MTDPEQLVTLRSWPRWSWKTLDPLAVEAATMGRLCEAVWAADRLMADRRRGGQLALERDDSASAGGDFRVQLTQQSNEALVSGL